MCEARFNPWVRKIPRKREWQPTPVFLPGESLGQRNLAGYSPWCHKELDMTEPLHTLTYTNHTKLSVIKRKMFYYVHGVCRSAWWKSTLGVEFFSFAMSGASAGVALMTKVWNQPEASSVMSGTPSGMNWRLRLAGDIDLNTYIGLSMWVGLPHSMAFTLQAGMSWEGGFKSKYSKRTGQKPYIWPWETQHHFCCTCWGSHKLVQGQIQEKGMWTTPLLDEDQRTCCLALKLSSVSLLGGVDRKKVKCDEWPSCSPAQQVKLQIRYVTGIALRHFTNRD